MAARELEGVMCPHCDCRLSKKTLDTHKRLYYDEESNKWIKKRCLIPSEHSEALATTEVALEEIDLDSSSDKGSVNSKSSADRPPLVEFDDESLNASLEHYSDCDDTRDISEDCKFAFFCTLRYSWPCVMAIHEDH